MKEQQDDQAENPYRAPRVLETTASDAAPVGSDGSRDGNARRIVAPLFCPDCGSYHSDSTGKLTPVRWSLDRLCPQCDHRLQVAGWVFPVIGVVLDLPCMLILSPYAETLGTMLLIAFLVFGIVRMAHERLIRRRAKKPKD